MLLLAAANLLTPMRAANPVITHLFTADPAALVHEGRVYLYTGHDEAPPGFNNYRMREWLCFSSADMVTWKPEGSPLAVGAFSWAKQDAWAAHVTERDGKFYYYVTVAHNTINGFSIGVAVADNPAGPFVDARGSALITNDMTTNPTNITWDDIDPAVFVDDDGQAWLFWGNTVCHYVKLKPNMIETEGPIQTVPLPLFTEAPWVHKRNGLYYLSYAYGWEEKIACATSPSISGPWTFRGVINDYVPNCNTNHQAIIEFKGQSYFIYHNGALPGGGSWRRSVCIDLLEYNSDGSIKPVVQTTAGVSAVPIIVPTGLAADASGNLYVSDSVDATIRKITPAGIATVHAGTSGVRGSADGAGSAASFRTPQGLAVDGAGNVYVADTGNSTIRKISPAGDVTTLAGSHESSGNTDGTGTAARFSSPADVAAGTGGVVFVADTGNHWIRRIDDAGTVTTPASASWGVNDGALMGVPTPGGIALNSAGDIYIVDTANNTLLKIAAATAGVSPVAGTDGIAGSSDGPGADALFSGPTGAAADSAGNIYVVDTQNSTIRKITPAGLVTTIAGLPGVAGFKDGPGHAAWFNKPRGIAVDSADNLYVADTGNAVVRKIASDGTVSTLAITAATTPGGSTPDDPPGGGTTPPVVPPPATPGNSTTGGSGGGGGAPSIVYLATLAALALGKRAQRKAARGASRNSPAAPAPAPSK